MVCENLRNVEEKKEGNETKILETRKEHHTSYSHRFEGQSKLQTDSSTLWCVKNCVKRKKKIEHTHEWPFETFKQEY
jgi:hypothetical protein